MNGLDLTSTIPDNDTSQVNQYMTKYLPKLDCKNLLPSLVSVPIACATSPTSAPVASHTALIALILEMRCARNALAACKIKIIIRD